VAFERPLSLAVARAAVGSVHLAQGKVGQGLPALEQAVAFSRDQHLPQMFPITASALGYAYALVGRVAEGLPLLEEALERATSMQVRRQQSLRCAWLSEAYLLAGRRDDAMHSAARALKLSRDHKERGHEAWALRLLGEIAAHTDPPEVDRAEGYYHQALALAEELGMRPLAAHCHLGLGTLYQQLGRAAPAHAELTTAAELYRAMEMTFWLGRAEAALARGG
jgi:tetratricopeptide (TPR) repeat protein